MKTIVILFALLCAACIAAEVAAALTRFMVSFFADEKHHAGFEKYLAEKRGKG